MATAAAPLPPFDVPRHLLIQVLHSDGSVVVIHKPCNLRSVPGHAKEPRHPYTPSQQKRATKRKRDGDSGGDGDIGEYRDVDPALADSSRDFVSAEGAKPNSLRRTAQEAWIEAIGTFSVGLSDRTAKKEVTEGEEALAMTLLRNLASRPRGGLASVPRKMGTFKSYCLRNRRRLHPAAQDERPSPSIGGGIAHFEEATRMAYNLLRERQRPLLKLPEKTRDEESAVSIGDARWFSIRLSSHCNLLRNAL